MNDFYYKGIIYFPNDFYYEKDIFNIECIKKGTFVYSIIETINTNIGYSLYVGLYSDKYCIHKIGNFKINSLHCIDDFEKTLNYYSIVLIKN